MKKIFSLLLTLTVSLCCFSACKKSELDKNKPVTLTMWHVYGEQADSPMNRLVEEFNQTIGMEKGIIINVTGMSNASYIGKKLLDAQAGNPTQAKCLTCFSDIKATLWKSALII